MILSPQDARRTRPRHMCSLMLSRPPPLPAGTPTRICPRKKQRSRTSRLKQRLIRAVHIWKSGQNISGVKSRLLTPSTRQSSVQIRLPLCFSIFVFYSPVFFHKPNQPAGSVRCSMQAASCPHCRRPALYETALDFRSRHAKNKKYDRIRAGSPP